MAGIKSVDAKDAKGRKVRKGKLKCREKVKGKRGK
jgi:hypothetical protein